MSDSIENQQPINTQSEHEEKNETQSTLQLPVNPEPQNSPQSTQQIVPPSTPQPSQPSQPPSTPQPSQSNPENPEEQGLLGKVNKKLNVATPLDSKGFQTKLFGCLESPPKYFLQALFCPCCVSAHTHTLLENRECTIFDFLCFPNAYQTRQRIRQQFNLPTDTGLDCIGSTCCYSCTIHQNARELERLTGVTVWTNNDETRTALAPHVQRMHS